MALKHAAFLAAFVLAACQKPVPPPAHICVIPAFVPSKAPAGSWTAEKEKALYCAKRAAYEIARAGGPLPPIAAAAVAQCADAQEAAIAALRKEGPVYAWERAQLTESLTHMAKISAAQARSIGCGRP